MDRTCFIRLIAGLTSLVCATVAHAELGVFTLPGAEDRPLEELGRVVVINDDPVLRSKVAGLFDANRKEIRRNLLLSVGARTLLLTPSIYTVTLHCDNGLGWYPMPTRLRVDAGRTYTLWCKSVQGFTARVKFKEQSHAEWEQSRAQKETDAVDTPESASESASESTSEN